MSDIATVKVELSDEQMEVLLRDIGDLICKVDALELRIEALEKRCGKIAAFSYGDNDSRIKDHERRINAIERKLNHKGGNE